MHHFSIQFAYWWSPLLYLLLIPALAFTLIPYFRLNKRYRRTRNRIISMVLHLVVTLLAVSALAGMTFHYTVSNDQNEIILLVDVSDTETESEERRDDFIEEVLNESGYDGFKVGVVTFGFDQEYAVPLTYETDTIFGLYKQAPLPDQSATDIAAALRYTTDLFTYPGSGKIVLITDGKETDEAALSVVRSVSALGTKVDCVNIGSDFADDKIQILGVKFPDYHVSINEKFSVEVTVRARSETKDTVIELSDNGTIDRENGSVTRNLAPGVQNIIFEDLVFTEEGLHEVTVKVTDTTDALDRNNTYCSYHYLEVFDNILLIDQGERAGESDRLEALLKEGGPIAYNVTTLHLSDGTVPDTIEKLRAYDQIILNNISNGDLRELPPPATLPADAKDRENWFVNLLYSYVNDYGGGLFTTGGTNGETDADGNVIAHAYNRKDLYNSRFQEMLPVEAINYTPPLGVIFIIDVSGSMEGEKVEQAKTGAVASLDVLSERDYVGVMTLDSNYGTVLQLTSRTEETRIKEAIMNVSGTGSTEFASAIKRAAEQLIAEKRIARRHIVIVSDGDPTQTEESYLELVQQFYRENEISFSVIGIQATSADKMLTLVDEGGGKDGKGHYIDGRDETTIIEGMREDLRAIALEEMSDEPFYPVISNLNSPVVSGVPYGSTEDGGSRKSMNVKLGGFYGVKARSNAETILTGEYDVPIYSQWKFGKGMVGSFMCDVGGGPDSFSQDFMADADGALVLRNIVATLMPTVNIRPSEIEIDLREGNYINQLSVYTDLESGQTVEGKITQYTEDGEHTYSLNGVGEAEGGCYITGALGAENRYTRASFVIKTPGVYKITVEKKDAAGNVIAVSETYKAFSYSQEYEMYAEESDFDGDAFLTELSTRGNGQKVSEEEPWLIFADFIIEIERVVDPRIAFMIIAMVLFLLDIAVRKFKFKWPHEIIRDHKERKALQK